MKRLRLAKGSEHEPWERFKTALCLPLMPRDYLCFKCHRNLKGIFFLLAPCRESFVLLYKKRCYNVLVGSRISKLPPWLGCWKKALFCSLHSPGRVCSIDFCAASGFLLITRSSLLPDSAMRGTTRQQSKSLVRTWLTWKVKKSRFALLWQSEFLKPRAALQV